MWMRPIPARISGPINRGFSGMPAAIHAVTANHASHAAPHPIRRAIAKPPPCPVLVFQSQDVPKPPPDYRGQHPARLAADAFGPLQGGPEEQGATLPGRDKARRDGLAVQLGGAGGLGQVDGPDVAEVR